MVEKIFYTVKCPRDNGSICKMELRRAELPDGSYLPAPPDGCNNCNGLEPCPTCVKVLFELSKADTTMNSYPQPINPLEYL